ncbi:MAG: hypothetical protein AAF663_01745 [Planctomycetota bacterium]
MQPKVLRVLFFSLTAASSAAVGFAAHATELADYVGQPLEVIWLRENVAWETSGGRIDDTGATTIASPAGSVAVLIDQLTPEAVRWTVTASAEGSSTTTAFIWNGRGWMADVLVSDWTVRIGEPGSVAPGSRVEQANTGPILIAFACGVLLYQVFIRSWRERSVHL